MEPTQLLTVYDYLNTPVRELVLHPSFNQRTLAVVVELGRHSLGDWRFIEQLEKLVNR